MAAGAQPRDGVGHVGVRRALPPQPTLVDALGDELDEARRSRRPTPRRTPIASCRARARRPSCSEAYGVNTSGNGYSTPSMSMRTSSVRITSAAAARPRAATCVYSCCGDENTSVGGAPLDDHAVAQHHHVVAQVADDAEVVRHEDQGEVVLVGQPAQQVEDLHAHRHVERADRLVADEQPRAAARWPGRWRSAAAGRPRTRAGSARATPGRARRPRAPRRSGRRGRPSTSRHTSGSRMIEAIVIRGSSELSGSCSTICASRRNQRSGRGRPGSIGRPRYAHLTARGPVEPEQDAHQRRLARARLADDPEAAALGERHVDAVERRRARRAAPNSDVRGSG